MRSKHFPKTQKRDKQFSLPFLESLDLVLPLRKNWGLDVF